LRLRGWWFLALLALCAAVAGLRWVDRTGRSLGVRVVGGEDSLRSLVFRIPDDGDITFDLPSALTGLRVMAHAELDPDVPAEESGEAKRFALRFQFTGWNDQIHERIYHFRSRINPVAGPAGELQPRSTYLRSAMRPLDVRSAFLTLSGLDFRPRQVVVSVAEIEHDLSGVAVRLYFQEEVAESRRHAQWPRLSAADRARRAEGNIYPHYLLSDFERNVLVRRNWAPLAPSGVEGSDYERRIVLWSNDTQSVVVETGNQGRVVPAGVRWVARAEAGDVLEFEVSLDDGRAADLGVEFIGSGGESLPVERVESDAMVSLSTPGNEGWLIVSGTSTLTVSAAVGSRSEQALKVETLRTFRCSSEPVRYRVVHLPGHRTPMRVDLRTIEDGGPPGDASFRLKDDDGKVVAEGRLATDSSLADHDWVVADGAPRRVSIAKRNYVLVPSEATTLDVACAQGGTVAVYNQPPDFEWAQRIPPNDAESGRRWYPIMPPEREELSELGLDVPLRIQEPPRPAMSPNSSSEIGQALRTFRVNPRGAGRDLLLPTPGGSDAESWRFRKLRDASSETLVFGSADGRGVAPTLLFRRERAEPFRLVVEVDGKVVVDEEWPGYQGELRLPRLRVGRRTVTVRGDGATEFFLNRVAGTSGSSFARRFVERLPDRAFDFEMQKRGPALLTGRLYFEPGANRKCTLQISAPQTARRVGVATTDWSYPTREYTISPAPNDRVPLLGGDLRWVDRSPPFFLRLGSDVPDGEVAVRLSPQCSSGIYLTLSQRAPSTETDRLFLQTQTSELW